MKPVGEPMLEVHVYTLYSGSLALFSIVPQFPHLYSRGGVRHQLLPPVQQTHSMGFLPALLSNRPPSFYSPAQLSG